MLRHALLPAALVLAACSGASSQTSAFTQSQAPVTPKGTIAARVVDGSTGQPLAEVTMTVVGGSGATLTTDAAGTATFTDAVVNSTYILIFEKAGYVRQVRTPDSYVPGSAGNSPLSGGVTSVSVTLYKGDAQLKGAVFLPDGTPASGVTVTIDQRDNGAGDSVLTTQTTADGTFTLTGVASPAGYYQNITIYPPDLNGDGTPDFEPIFSDLDFYPGSTSRAFFTFAQSTNTLQRVIGSNLLVGSVAAASELKLIFANPVLPTNLDGNADGAFTLTDTTTGVRLGAAVTWSSPTQVSVKPVLPLTPGARYQLAVAVTSSHVQPGTDPNFFQYFSFQCRPDSVTPISTQVTNLTVQNPLYLTSVQRAQYDWNTNGFQLQWDSVAGATRYAVYAKDTRRNLDWVLVQRVGASGVSRNALTVALPLAFDQFPGAPGTQPLAQGNVVTFTVVPYDVYGYLAPIAAAPVATVSDNLPPTIVTAFAPVTTMPLFGLVDAINDDQVPAQWLFVVRYSEPMDPAMPPTFTGNGAPQTLWQGAWDPNTGSFQYTLTLTIAVGGDASGKFLVRGGRDVAGNQVINGDFQSSLAGFRTLNLNPAFEDASSCQITGWNVTSSGGMPAVTSVLATGLPGIPGTSTRCAAVVGAPDNAAPALGVARMSQDVSLPTIPTGSGWYFISHADARGTFIGGAPAGLQTCEVTDTSDVVLPGQSLISFAGNFSSSPATQAYNVGAPVSTARMTCKVDNSLGVPVANNTALYVDNFTLWLYKPGAM